MDPSAINGWFYIAGASITVGIPSLLTLWLSQRSHRALTKNHHESKKPTVPDRIDDVKTELRELRKEIAETNQLVLMHILDHGDKK